MGLSIGSFINAFSWRYYENNEIDIKDLPTKIKNKNLSIISGRSMCTHCFHQLSYYDLIPVISWLMLRGKCRYCHKKISLQYPVIEVFSAVLTVSYVLFLPYTINALGVISLVLLLVIFYGLISLIILDFKWYILPTKIIYSLFIVGIVYTILNIGHISIFNLIISTFIGGGLFYFLYIISSGKWIGGGDIRLGFLLGFMLGNFRYAILLIFLSSLIGSLTSLFLISFKRLSVKSAIPFGPFLIFSYVIIQLFGRYILVWAKNHYLIA